MIRGRVGGSGASFNMVEITVTRASSSIDSGHVGIGYAVGRSPRKAELVALLEGAFQADSRIAGRPVVESLAALQRRRKDTALRKAAATKVDFFTLVRGESPK